MRPYHPAVQPGRAGPVDRKLRSQALRGVQFAAAQPTPRAGSGHNRSAGRGVRVGLRSATGNRVPAETWVAGSNPALSALSLMLGRGGAVALGFVSLGSEHQNGGEHGREERHRSEQEQRQSAAWKAWPEARNHHRGEQRAGDEDAGHDEQSKLVPGGEG